MDNSHRNIIRKLRVFFVKNLQSLEEILDILESEQIISENLRHSILSGNIPAERIRSFLDSIVRCGPRAYSEFKRCLSDTNQNDILKEMDNTENSLLSTTSDCVGPMSVPTFKPLTKEEVFVSDVRKTYPLEPYIVNSSPHGYVLIMNIETYVASSGVTSRHGSSRDVEKLKSLFEDFHYSVGVINNPTAEELKSSVAQFVLKPEHASVHAVGLIILAHGLEHHIITSDGLHVDLDDLIGCFTNRNFSSFAGKPKFIIVQACRGEERRHCKGDKVDSSTNSVNLSVDVSLDPNSWLSLPYMSDCVIIYSTLPGFVSWRSEVEGSWYVKVLVEVFRLYGHRLHILELLTEINNRLIGEASSVSIKQISQPVTTLTKPFYLSTLT